MFEDNLIDLRKDLHSADININITKYVKISILLSLFSTVILTLFVMQIDTTLNFVEITLIISIFFLFALLIAKRFPKTIARSRAMSIESDLPIAIRTIGIQLNMHVQFEDTLRNIASSNYRCSKEFRKVVKMIESGASIPDALRQMAKNIDSSTVKKMVVQLIRAYSEGLSGVDLKRQADELISTQRFRFKEFSARISFLSLMFIALACIAPTMFLAYGTISSLYLGSSLTPSDIWFVFLVVFPLVNAALIFYIKLRTPPTLTNIKENLFSKKERHIMESQLHALGIKSQFIHFFVVLWAVSIAIVAACIYGGFFAGIIFIMFPVVVYFLLLMLAELKDKEIEDYLPDALLYASMMEYGVPMEKIIDNIASSGYKKLSDEFAIASRQIRAGTGVLQAFEDMRARNNSMLLDRVITLLAQCYKTGKDVHVAIRETAEDIFELNIVAKEQSASLSMQKYTILIGGCILVPTILAIVINVVSSIEAPYTTTVSAASAVTGSLLLNAAADAVRAYLIIYVLLASFFVAYQEGRTRTFIGYAILFVPLVLLIFSFVRDNIKLA